MANTALIVGASGLVGTATLEHFLEHSDWDVIAISRRKPEVISKRPFQHISVDLTDSKNCQNIFSQLSKVQYVVYAALFEKPGALTESWVDPEQMEINRKMFYNLITPLANTAKLRHVTILQGTKAYGLHHHAIPIPARENAPRDPHDNFYWQHEDLLREAAEKNDFKWTILRPPGIFGTVYGVAMSFLPVIGAYGAICRELGEPFSFPGGNFKAVGQLVDAKQIARVCFWNATEPKAANRTFNVLNGDVYEWHNLWPAIAKVLGLNVGPDHRREMKSFMPNHSKVWDRIVQKHQLLPTSMDDLLGGGSHYFADLMLGTDSEEAPPPAFITDYELRKAGFKEFVDTETAICESLQQLIDRKVLPPALN